MKYLLSLLIVPLLFTFSPPELTVSGTITDKETGEALPGVTVLVVGTNNGVLSDVYGKYKLTIPEGYNKLKFSYVGMQIQEVEINGRNKIDVKMTSDGVVLDEVVVSGYSSKKKSRKLGYSLQKARKKEKEELQVAKNIALDDYESDEDIAAEMIEEAAVEIPEVVVVEEPEPLAFIIQEKKEIAAVQATPQNIPQRQLSGNTAGTEIRGGRTSGNTYYIDGVKIKGKSTVNSAAVPQMVEAQKIQTESLKAAPKVKIKPKVVIKKDPKPEPIITPADNDQPRAKKDFSGEGYEKIYENDFKMVDQSPLSTFSIDVDKASYSNMRRFINNEQLPPPSAVRIEELVNYFKYDYPQPKNDQPFAVFTDITEAPWSGKNKLVHIGIKGKKLIPEEAPASNLVFLIDVSGSMSSYNKLPLLQKSFNMLVDNLRAEDRVAIVVYAGAAGAVLPSTSGISKETIKSAINNLRAGGSTAGGAGIKLAYNIAKENFIKGGNNRVILATDGDFNVGVSNDTELVKLIEEKRQGGVFLTVLGFGTGNYQDSKMEKIADHGNGNYAYIDSYAEAKKVLVKEMNGTLFTIAKDVKIQIEFNPTKVKAYRLIGYENRMLKNRDFNDDTKDAGELGAGHTVTALYEIVPAGGDVPLASNEPLKYQPVPVNYTARSTDEVMTVKLRYKKPDEDKSKLIEQPVRDRTIPLPEASENLRFASAVAEFGMLLRHSKYRGNASFDSVLERARRAKGVDLDGYRAEFIKLVEVADLLSRE